MYHEERLETIHARAFITMMSTGFCLMSALSEWSLAFTGGLERREHGAARPREGLAALVRPVLQAADRVPGGGGVAHGVDRAHLPPPGDHGGAGAGE